MDTPPELITLEMSIAALEERINQLQSVESISIVVTPAALSGILDIGRQLLVQGQQRSNVIRQLRTDFEEKRDAAVDHHLRNLEQTQMLNQFSQELPPVPPRPATIPPDGIPVSAN